MANPEHLAILRQGVKRWNNWRQQYPEMHPDLSEARLEGADLRDADLSETFLVDADLNHANLSGANLRKAGLPSANLGGANLQQASLEGAELTYANLTTANLRNADLYAASLQLTMVSGTILVGANLRGAKFRGTHFAGAHLAGSDFTNAVARSAIFSDVDLSTVSGLGEMFHEGPSTIGIDTIYKSHGQIPKVFLRGCGLADWEIEAAKLYDPSLSAADAKDIASRVLLIWLLQQAPIGSVEGCPDRRFRRRYANFKPTSPAKRPASSTWRLVAGPMVSSVLDADIGEPTNW